MTIASALRVESFDFKERRFNDFGITWVVETIESSSAQRFHRHGMQFLHHKPKHAEF